MLPQMLLRMLPITILVGYTCGECCPFALAAELRSEWRMFKEQLVDFHIEGVVNVFAVAICMNLRTTDLQDASYASHDAAIRCSGMTGRARNDQEQRKRA